MRLTHFKSPRHLQYEGRSVADVVESTGKNVVDAVCDLLLEEDLQVCYSAPRPNGESQPDFVVHPLAMIGSDALLIGDFPSHRTYGTFPAILSTFVREEGSLTLEDAIRRMTSFPAQRLGISDRGILRDGMEADVVVFDPATIEAPCTPESPRQLARGVDYVMVNGRLVIDGGRHTGATPGKSLRHRTPHRM